MLEERLVFMVSRRVTTEPSFFDESQDDLENLYDFDEHGLRTSVLSSGCTNTEEKHLYRIRGETEICTYLIRAGYVN